MVQFIAISSLSSTNLRVRNGFELGHSLFSTVESGDDRESPKMDGMMLSFRKLKNEH